MFPLTIYKIRLFIDRLAALSEGVRIASVHGISQIIKYHEPI